MAAEYYYTYTGRDGDIVPRHVTHVRIDKSVKFIPNRAFFFHRNIREVECHNKVEIIEEEAFSHCESLRRVIMPGVKNIEDRAFYCCEALAIVECDKLEIIGVSAFSGCKLRSINLPSAQIVKLFAFVCCEELADVKFGNELESIGLWAFEGCRSLRRIALTLKDGMITRDIIFTGCENLEHVDLVKGALHETVAALQLEGWRNDMNEEIDSINQILPHTPAGEDSYNNKGEKAIVIRTWIRSVLRKLIGYKAQHHRLLMEAATTLELALLPKDIVIENVLPFLELPSYTFEVQG
eukprot:scaffold14195_cov155-Skeletonema_dohrnii-CCMP3373.AAC.6